MPDRFSGDEDHSELLKIIIRFIETEIVLLRAERVNQLSSAVGSYN